MDRRAFGHRAPLLWLSLPYMAGLSAGAGGLDLPVLPTLLLALAAATVSGFLLDRPVRWSGSLVLAMVLAGTASQNLHRQDPAGREALPPREAELTIRVGRLFASRWPDRISGLGVVTDAPIHLADLRGQRLYLSLEQPTDQPRLVRSAVIAAVGVLAPVPPGSPADSFDSYLTAGGIPFRYTPGRVLEVREPGSAYRRWCATMAARFKAVLSRGIVTTHPDLAAAYRAMVLGERQDLGESQTQAYRLSGTMHVFSISGLHIAVIAGALTAGLSLLRVPPRIRIGISLILLWLYVDITGTVPSAVRAFIMVALLDAAFVLRRPINPVAALAASTLVVLLIAPLQLFSASFQMSYAIVAAILLLGLPLAEAWRDRWNPYRDLPPADWRWWHHAITSAGNHLGQLVAIGLASTPASLITGLQFFGLTTPGALLVNLAVIPAAGMVVYAGFFSLLAGIAGIPSWSVLFNHAALVLLAVVQELIRAFLQLPGAWFHGQFRAPWAGSATLALFLASLLAGYGLRWTHRAGGYLLPFGVTAAALLLLVSWG